MQREDKRDRNDRLLLVFGEQCYRHRMNTNCLTVCIHGAVAPIRRWPPEKQQGRFFYRPRIGICVLRFAAGIAAAGYVTARISGPRFYDHFFVVVVEV